MENTHNKLDRTEQASMAMQLAVCQFINAPTDVLERKFIRRINEELEELATLPTAEQDICAGRIKALLNDPAVLYRTKLGIAMPIFKMALEKGGLNFAKFWQSCLNGLPQTKLLY